MKKRNNDNGWIEKWKNEIESHTGPMSHSLKNAELPTCENEPQRVFRFNGSFIGKTVGVLATLVFVVGIVLFIGLKTLPNDDSFVPTAVVVEINPKAAFLTDKSGYVTDVTSLNADADVVFSGDGFAEGIIGKPLSDAVVLYTNEAMRLGYINPDGDSVTVSALDNESFPSVVKGATEKLENYFKEKGIYAAVFDKAVDESSLCALCGIETDGGVIDSLKSLATLSFSRLEEENADYSELYENGKAAAVIKEYVEERVKEFIALNENKAEDILAIKELNLQIASHPDNPIPFIPGVSEPLMAFTHGYFVLSDFSRDILGEELYSLVGGAGDEILRLESVYDTQIDSLEKLELAEDICTSVNEVMTEIEGMLGKFAIVLVIDAIFSNPIVAELKDKLEDVESLLTSPVSYEDYISKMTSVTKVEYSERINEFESLYKADRESISDSDYESFVQNFIKK